MAYLLFLYIPALVFFITIVIIPIQMKKPLFFWYMLGSQLLISFIAGFFFDGNLILPESSQLGIGLLFMSSLWLYGPFMRLVRFKQSIEWYQYIIMISMTIVIPPFGWVLCMVLLTNTNQILGF